MTESNGIAPPASPRSATSSLSIFQVVALLALLQLVLFSHCVSKTLDHDEHQFVAAGALVARHGLMPYRDFACFHCPYMVYVYAALFRLTSYPFFAARIFATVCGAATVALISSAVYQIWPQRQRAAAAVLAGLVLITEPLFFRTDGISWNHDLAELLIVAAVLFVLGGISRGYTLRRLFFAGAMMGCAVGVRLTAAPLLAAMAVFILSDSGKPPNGRWRATAAFCAGAGLSLLPLFYIFASAPAAFLFGNFRYPQLSAIYLANHGIVAERTNSLGKVTFIFTNVLSTPGAILLVGVAAYSVIVVRNFNRSGGHPFRRERGFLGVVLIFLLIGAFAPTPLYVFYFYAPLPIAVLWIAYAIAPLASEMALAPKWARIAAIGVLALCIIPGLFAYSSLSLLLTPGRWEPIRIHRYSQSLREARRGDGPVLTLAPIFAVEAGLDIYPCYATGPFAARVAPMLSPEEQRQFKLADGPSLVRLLEAHPPSAVLIGPEKELEEPLKPLSQRFHCPLASFPSRKQGSADERGQLVVEEGAGIPPAPR